MSAHGTSKRWKTLGSCLCTSQATSGATLAPYVFNKTSQFSDTNNQPIIFFYAQDYVISCRRHLTCAISEIQSCFFLLQKTRKRFLKGFMPRLRRKRTQKRKLKKLFKQISSSRPKRGAGTEGWAAVLAFHIIVKGWQTQSGACECLMWFLLFWPVVPEGCTVGNITQLTVSDGSFPFGYDQTQFDLCLDLPVLRENLYSICEKVDDDNFQKVILRKLNEVSLLSIEQRTVETLPWIHPHCVLSQVFPSGVSEENVQLLGSVSRVASLEDISKWNITKVDTLAALMEADNGPWEAAKVCAVLLKGVCVSLHVLTFSFFLNVV